MRRALTPAMVLASAWWAAAARAATVQVSTPAELASAVAQAGAGDVIELRDGSYTLATPLDAAAVGSAAAPIRITATHPHLATLVAGPGVEEALRISGPFWVLDGVDVQGGTFGVRFVGGGSDGLVRDAVLRDAALAGVRADCGGPEAQAHCDRGRLERVEVTRPTATGDCSFAGVEIVGGVGWQLAHVWVHDVAVDTLACPTPATAGLVARANAQGLAADALVVDGLGDGIWLGPASNACDVRGTVTSGTSCTPPTACAVQDALVTNALLVDAAEDGARFENACGAALHNATLWNDGTAFGGLRSVELRGTGSVDVSNTILNAAVLADAAVTQSGGGNLILPAPSDGSFFLDAAQGNFRLADGSPAIDQGVALGDVRADLDGVPRPQGAAWDVGAYERPLGGYPDGGIPMLDGGIDGGATGPGGAVGGFGGGMTGPPREGGCQCGFAAGGAGLGLLAPLLLALLLLWWGRGRARTE